MKLNGKSVVVTGASSGMGKAICRAAHRPERFAELSGAQVTDSDT